MQDAEEDALFYGVDAPPAAALAVAEADAASAEPGPALAQPLAVVAAASCGVGFGKPSRRTAFQHQMLTSKMREAKSRKQLARERDTAASNDVQFSEKVNSTGGLDFGVRMELCRRSNRNGGIRLVIRHEHLKDRRRRFSYGKMLGIAFCHIKAAKVLGTIYQCHHSQIRRVQLAVAHAFLSTQNLLYDCLQRLVCQRRPTFACSRVMWDETGEKLRMASSIDTTATMTSEQRSSTLQVMICKMAFVWGWKSGPRPCDWTTCQFEVVCPPMMVVSPSAQNLWAALMKNKTIAPLMRFRRALFAAADIGIELKECDGASGNDRLVLSCHEP